MTSARLQKAVRRARRDKVDAASDLSWVTRRARHLDEARRAGSMTLDELAEWETTGQVRRALEQRIARAETILDPHGLRRGQTSNGPGYGQPRRIRSVVSGGAPGLGRR